MNDWMNDGLFFVWMCACVLECVTMVTCTSLPGGIIQQLTFDPVSIGGEERPVKTHIKSLTPRYPISLVNLVIRSRSTHSRCVCKFIVWNVEIGRSEVVGLQVCIYLWFPTRLVPYDLNLVPRGGTKESRWMTELKSGTYCSIYCSIRIEQNLCLLFGQLGLCRQGKIVTLHCASESSSKRKKNARRSMKWVGGIYWTLVTLDVSFQTKERLKKADWAKM